MVDTVGKKIPKHQTIEKKHQPIEKETKKSTPKKGIGCAIQPIESKIPSEPISSTGKQNRASWIMKPNFSNRTSSLRNMARSWNRSKDSTNEEHASM